MTQTTRKYALTHKDLEIYQLAFESAVQIFELTKGFPAEEKYALTDQIRSSSRAVCANMAEAWRARRYRKAFIAKLNICEMEAAETQTWLDFAAKFGYLEPQISEELSALYDRILGGIVAITRNPQQWIKDSSRIKNRSFNNTCI